MNKTEVIEALSNLKKEAREKYKAEIKGIFGSFARGDEKVESDLDILVEFQNGADLFDFVSLSDFLEQHLNCKVDVVSERGLRKELKPYVYQDVVYL